jgi:hypothetical protein
VADDVYWIFAMIVHPLYVNYSESRRGGEAMDDGPWASHEPEYIDLTIKHLYTEKDNYAEEVKAFFEPKVGDDGYLVTARYQTGSTFGTTSGKFVFVACYDTYDMAKELAREIEKHYDTRKNRKESYSFTPKTPYDGKIWCSWIGYFERLEDVEVDSYIIRTHPKR